MDVASPLDTVREALEKSLFGKTVRDFARALAPRPGYREAGDRLCGYALEYVRAAHPDKDPALILRGHFQRFVMAYLEEYKNFRQTFRYSHGQGDFQRINETVYQSGEAMEPYLLSLLVSYVFFPHHYEELTFYADCVAELPGGARSIDFGSGHGLFSLLTLQVPGRSCECVDIAPTAAAMTSFLLERFAAPGTSHSVAVDDAVRYAPRADNYDFMICCGFLEHIEDPAGFLARALPRLADAGRMFVMLPVNTPHPDHIIHFKTTREVDEFLAACGLCAVRKRVIPTEDVSVERAEAEAVPIVHLTLCQKDVTARPSQEATP